MTRVLRGRTGSPAADRTVTAALMRDLRGEDETAVRVWFPRRHVAFGRRDVAAEGYERARAAAGDRGFPPVERHTGGRAVAYTGVTLAFVRATAASAARTGVTARYERMVADLRAALAALGVDARPGEPAASFCPGTHSLRAAGKLAGLAQRVGRGTALVGGQLVVRDHDAIAEVLAPVYDALDVPFDPETVDSVANAGVDADPERVRQTVESALVDGPLRIEHVDGLLDRATGAGD